VTQALIVSNVVLWIAVVVLSGVVAALVRQIGVLYERVAPAGALMTGRGPAVGEAAPVVHVDDLGGAHHDVGAPRADGRGTLVFFLSPTCPVCKTLLPALRSAARRERAWLAVVLASDGPREEHARFIAAEGLEAFPYVLSPQLGIAYQVGKLPYAILLDAAGVVRARGLVNTREHLESLFEAHERGLATIQDWAQEEQERQERLGVVHS
jgi:methylamine dehydrogenase accessory protein MauD